MKTDVFTGADFILRLLEKIDTSSIYNPRVFVNGGPSAGGLHW
jgi:hypothetical protein